MKRRILQLAVWLACLAPTVGPALAQDWTTYGNDAQRSGWLRADPVLNSTSVKGPDFQFLWKFQFDNEASQMNSLTPPALLDFYIGYRGFRSLAFLGGSDNNLFVIDTDLSRSEWVRKLSFAPPSGESSLACPGGMTSQVTRPTSVGLPMVRGFRGFGRQSPGKSGVGEPNEGAVTLAEAGSQTFRPPPNAETPSSRQRKPTNFIFRGLSLIHAVSGEGTFHSLQVSDGYDHAPPVKFLPPNSNATGLIVIDSEAAYVSTRNGCGGAPDGVWALDLATNTVSNWKSKGSVAGPAGPAFSPEGNVYAATAGGQVVSLQAKTLKQLGAYEPSGVSFTSSPVVIDRQEKDYLAVAAKEGTLHLLAGADLSKALSKTPDFASADFVPGALATWKDEAGVDWVLAPLNGALASGVKFPATNGAVTNGAIVAWKIVDAAGSLKLEPGWVSRDMLSPLPPIVVNGVVFAAASGEHRPGDASVSAEQRNRQSKPAVLYALDGATGKVLWESKDKIQSFASGAGLASGGSTVYLTTHDGALYAFGFPIEH